MIESSMTGYKEFLEHLGIDPILMVADMRSRIPDSEKPRILLTTKAQKVSERRKQMTNLVTGHEDFIVSHT